MLIHPISFQGCPRTSIVKEKEPFGQKAVYISRKTSSDLDGISLKVSDDKIELYNRASLYDHKAIIFDRKRNILNCERLCNPSGTMWQSQVSDADAKVLNDTINALNTNPKKAKELAVMLDKLSSQNVINKSTIGGYSK